MKKNIYIILFFIIFIVFNAIHVFAEEKGHKETDVSYAGCSVIMDEHHVELYEHYADTNSDDDFDVFDDLLEEKESEENENIFQQLSGNFSGESKFRYSWFFDEITVANPGLYGEPDDQHFIYDIQFNVTDFLMGDFWKFYIELLLQVGNQKETYKAAYSDIEEYSWEEWFQDMDRRRNYIEARELYASFFIGNVDITVGKKIFTNTLSTLHCPADMYYVRDYNDQLLLNKLGRLLLEIDIYFSTLALNLVLFPVHEVDKPYGPLSRWGYYTMIDTFTPAPATTITTIYDNYPDISVENLGYLARLKGTLFNVDFFLSAFHGLSNNIVYKVVDPLPPMELREEVVNVFNASLGFSAVLDKLELHGEGLYNLSYDSKDDDYIRYVIGFRYVFDFFPPEFFINKVECTAEYAGELLIHNQSNDSYSMSTEGKRLLKNDVLINLLIQAGEKWKTNILGQYEIEGESFIIKAGTEYSGLYDFSFGIACEFYLVKKGSDYYNWRHNNRVLASITYAF
jgi:hypothetical protein